MLLLHALFHGLFFGIADFRPALVRDIVRMGIGVDHRDDGLIGADIRRAHQLISFTWVSMNVISASSRPYFRYS